MKVCNIEFEDEVPVEVLAKAFISKCKSSVSLPRRVKAKVYYDPECPACKRLFIFMMRIENIEVKAVHFSKGIDDIMERIGTIAIPFTIIENGKWLRGCPRDFNDFYVKLVEAVSSEGEAES